MMNAKHSWLAATVLADHRVAAAGGELLTQ